MKSDDYTENSLPGRVASFSLENGLLKGGESVVVGLSGGPDSVCLLLVLHCLGERFRLKLSAVYVNHNLRPDEVKSEIVFCETLCASLEVPFLVKSVDVLSYSGEHGMNRHEAARALRYAAFEEAAGETGADLIALAHNADDQAETFLMRLLRGSGPRGLSGMPIRRGKIVRPLLQTPRTEIECYLAEQGKAYLTDSSNLKTDYLRNRLRIEVMPLLKSINPSFVESTFGTAMILAEEERYFDIQVTKTLMRMISRKNDRRIELFLSPMESMEPVLLRRVLRRAIAETRGLRSIGFNHIEDIIKLVRKGASGDRIYLPGGLRVIRDYSLLVLTSEPPGVLASFDLEPPGEVALFGAGAVIRSSFEDRNVSGLDGRAEVCLDADKMKFPLIIRPRKPGDHFYPAGFGKRKKLQDFFTDLKIPRDERDMVPLVVSGDDIVWVAGYRSDERFRPTDATKKHLRLAVVKGKF